MLFKCPNCGCVIEDGMFCPKCGGRLVAEMPAGPAKQPAKSGSKAVIIAIVAAIIVLLAGGIFIYMLHP